MLRRQNPRISVDQKITILRGLLPLPDHGGASQDVLVRAGFQAFLPRQHFAQSFCAPGEAAVHDQIAVESAREAIATPRPHQGTYRSPLLDRLRRELAAHNGANSYGELQQRPGWTAVLASIVDPCTRRMEQFKTEHIDDYMTRIRRVKSEESQCVAREAARHSTGLSRSHSYDKDGRRRFFREAMSMQLAPLGFTISKALSNRTTAVLSKPLAEGWHLAWCLEDSRDILGVRFNAPTGDTGWLTPTLHVRADDKRGDLEKKGHLTQVLAVAFQEIIPFFKIAYRDFSSLDEIEIIVKAHAYLYQQVSEMIESPLRDGFSQIAS